MTNQDKYKATKQAIITLLQASGPCTMPEITREVINQGFLVSLPAAMLDLWQKRMIKFCAEEQSFEMYQ